MRVEEIRWHHFSKCSGFACESERHWRLTEEELFQALISAGKLVISRKMEDTDTKEDLNENLMHSPQSELYRDGSVYCNLYSCEDEKRKNFPDTHHTLTFDQLLPQPFSPTP